MSYTAAQIAEALHRDFPLGAAKEVVENYLLKNFKDVPIPTFLEAIDIAYAMSELDEVEETIKDPTVDDMLRDLVTALKVMKVPVRDDEPLWEAARRAPPGHPAHEISNRTIKCSSCGGLQPLYKTNLMIDPENGWSVVCVYCGSSDIARWIGPKSKSG